MAPKLPISVSTPGVNVPRANFLMEETARSASSILTPASRYRTGACLGKFQYTESASARLSCVYAAGLHYHGNHRGASYAFSTTVIMKPVTVLLLCVASALAQEPSAVAIRNAKIVTVSGPVIAKGTVVVRKGLIEAVGENVAVPADAMVVEGEGLTVYPGLIDSLSTVGQPGAAAAPAPTTVDAAADAARPPRPQPDDSGQSAGGFRGSVGVGARQGAARSGRPAANHQLGQDRRRGERHRPAHRNRAQRGLHHRGHLSDARHLRRAGRRDRSAQRRKTGRDGGGVADRAVHFGDALGRLRRRIPQFADGLHRLRAPALYRHGALQDGEGRLREESARHAASGVRPGARRADGFAAHSAAGRTAQWRSIACCGWLAGTEAADRDLRRARGLPSGRGGDAEEVSTCRCC